MIVCGFLVAFALALAGWEKAQATSAVPGPPGRVEPKLRFVSGGPEELTVDGAGNMYGADCQDAFVFRVSTRRALTIVAGNGTQGFSGNGGLGRVRPRGRSRRRSWPARVAWRSTRGGTCSSPTTRERPCAQDRLERRDPCPGRSGADTAGRRVDGKGVITTVAGNGEHGYSGDGGPATKARLSDPYGLVLDARGNLYVAEPDEGVVRKIDRNGVITTVAGTGKLGFSGDGGPAMKAKLNSPFGLVLDAAGNLYIADNGNGRIRKVDRRGVITTFLNGR